MSRTTTGMHYLDLWHGVEFKPQVERIGHAMLSFAMEAHGFGAMRLGTTASGRTCIRSLNEMRCDGPLLQPHFLVTSGSVLPQHIVRDSACRDQTEDLA